MSPHQPSAFSRFGENHSIETPEQTRLEFAVAGIGSRFLALALDLIIQTLVAVILVIVAAMAGVSGLRRWIPQSPQWGAAVLIALFFVLHFGYFAGFEILWSGQTPGSGTSVSAW